MEEKAALRLEMARTARQWDAAYLRASDREIARRVRALEAWRRAETLFCYVSAPLEVDTRALIAEALAAGRRVAAPRCLGGGRMEARAIASLEELAPGRYGLLEPPEGAPLVRPEALELSLIPCVAADRRGLRLGRGGGYYDRYLERARGLRVCLCRAAALLDAVPQEDCDRPVDIVLTESETVCRAADAGGR